MNIQETARLIRAISEEYSQNRAAGEWQEIRPVGPLPPPFTPVLVRYEVPAEGVSYTVDYLLCDGVWGLGAPTSSPTGRQSRRCSHDPV